MAVFKCDIPSDHNEMIKLAARENMQSRQKYIEQLIIESAKKQARKVLKNKGE